MTAHSLTLSKVTVVEATAVESRTLGLDIVRWPLVSSGESIPRPHSPAWTLAVKLYSTNCTRISLVSVRLQEPGLGVVQTVI